MVFPLWAAAVIVAAEYYLFSFTFDASELRRRTDLWALAGYWGSLAVYIGAAISGVVLVAQSRSQRLRLLLVARRLDRSALRAVAAHLGSLCLLWWLTSQVLSSSGPPAGAAVGWLVLWFTTAAATPLFLVAAAFPTAPTQESVIATWPALLGGTVIGAGAWLAGQGSTVLWHPLGPWTLRAVERSLRVVVGDTYYDPANSVIGSDRFQVIIATPCSGFEGVGLMSVFTVAYLLLARRRLRFPHALLLLPLGLAASLVANVGRLVALILVGTYISGPVAVGGFHARAGWLFFCALAFTLVWASQRLQFFAREPGTWSLSHPTGAYLLPFLMLVAVGLVTGLGTVSIDLLYGLRILAATLVLLALRRHYRSINWSCSWGTVAAGLLAAIVFVGLSPMPSVDTMRAWHSEWIALPIWTRASWTVVRALGSIVIVPLAEELAFRGYALRRLASPTFDRVSPGHFSPWALLISSIAFGAVHASWVGGTLAGLLFGFVQIRGKGISHAIVAHGVSNVAVAVYVLAFDQWWLWM